MSRLLIIPFASIALIVSYTASLAQEQTIGAREFKNSCAVCHGVSGKGDGPMAGIIDEPVSNLTTLAKDNEGIFPVSRIYEVIDGRTEVAWHGTRDMPIWGNEYDAQTPEMLGYEYSTADAEAFVRARILALIEHISSLQEQ